MECRTILGFAAAKEMMEVTTTVEFEMCTSFAPSVLTQFFYRLDALSAIQTTVSKC